MPGRELCQGLVVQCAVRPMLVVVPAPGCNQDTGLGQRRKPMVVQALIPEPPVEALNERVLGRLPGLDQLELNSMLASPLIQCPAGKLRSLVSPDGLGVATKACRLIENPCHVVP